MTRPIYEPSLTRTDRRLGFSADQLFRRPAPTAEGAGIFEYAIVSAPWDTITVNNTTWTSVPGANLFSNCFTTGPGDYLQVQEVSANEFQLNILQPCYLLVSVSIDWTTDFQAQKAAQLLPTGIWQPTGSTGPIFALPFLGTHAHFGCPFEVSWGGGGSQTVSLQVWQNSGVAKSVNGSTGIGIFVVDPLTDNPFFC